MRLICTALMNEIMLANFIPFYLCFLFPVVLIQLYLKSFWKSLSLWTSYKVSDHNYYIRIVYVIDLHIYLDNMESTTWHDAHTFIYRNMKAGFSLEKYNSVIFEMFIPFNRNNNLKQNKNHASCHLAGSVR